MGPIYKRRLPVLFIVIAILLLAACSHNANNISDVSPSVSVTQITPTPSALNDLGSPPASEPLSRPSTAPQTAVTPSGETAPPVNISSAPAKTGTQVADSSALISKITVTFYGDASTAKGFTWYTNRDSKSSDVQIVKKTSPAPDFSQAVTFTGTVAVPHNSPDEIVHKAAALGLTSNQTYYYRVGDAALNVWSSAGVFTTAPTRGPFTFIDLSDTQFAGQSGAKVAADTISMALAQSKNAGFIINNGDVVDNKSEELWDLCLKMRKSS
jgi:hypothetical protein